MKDSLDKEVKKSWFIIALPTEFSNNVGNVEGYANVHKIGLIIATTPAGAVSHYLHRDEICNKPKLVINKLNRMGGKQKAGKYAFNISEIESGGSYPEPEDRRTAMQVFAADFLARRYGGTAESYWSRVVKLFNGFENNKDQQ